MSAKLKDKATSGFIWSAIERFSVQGVHFILGIFMARILSPSDFGIIGMLAIFLALSQSIIDSGFSNALVQKKNRTQVDYSTVFYFNIAVGLILYIILFFSSSLIANFYDLPILIPVTKVIAINLFINSFIIVQRAKLAIELNFKVQAKISGISALLSGLLGLLLAIAGCGVWALVYQSILCNLLNLILLWIYVKWKPSWCFSWDSFKGLFQFGSKLLITGLYGPIFENLNILVIGKFYSSVDLGYYTRASSFSEFPSSNISSIITRVSFPILSELQDDNKKLCAIYRKLVRISSFIVFPLMLGLGAIAEPLIKIILTPIWLPTAIYMQLLCFSLIWYPICAFSINLLLVKGLSKIHLKLDFVKKIIALSILYLTANISVYAICIGMIFSALFSWLITAYYAGRFIHLSFFRHLLDVLPSLLISILTCIGICIINSFHLEAIYTIVLDLCFLIVCYAGLSYLFNRNDFYTVLELIIRRKL